MAIDRLLQSVQLTFFSSNQATNPLYFSSTKNSSTSIVHSKGEGIRLNILRYSMSSSNSGLIIENGLTVGIKLFLRQRHCQLQFQRLNSSSISSGTISFLKHLLTRNSSSKPAPSRQVKIQKQITNSCLELFTGSSRSIFAPEINDSQ